MHINVLVREMDVSIENISQNPWAGVDHGVYLLLKEGIIPQYTYGDFDSITEEERRFIDEKLDINPVESEKDDTDLEIALLDLTGRGYTSIDVYGATGGRLDHLLGNTQMLLHEKLTDVKIRIRSEERRVGKECRSGWVRCQGKRKKKRRAEKRANACRACC